jgi:4-amino-4-deoxy-L-arabinose transferase-like glycosyltransferase
MPKKLGLFLTILLSEFLKKMNHKYQKKINYHFWLLSIIFLGFCLRIIGLNWDQGLHLHPDERFLTMLSSSITFPKNIAEYFNTTTSTFNPNNNGYSFYVYGTFPLLITKTIAQILNLNSYDQIFYVGRMLSSIFDTLTILLIFLISIKFFKNIKTALFSAFLYSICIFPIQQSHFFTVDAITVFFFTLTLYLLISQKTALSGVVFGITLASKTSIGIILPLILLFIFFQDKKLFRNFIKCFLFIILLTLSFRIFQPYAFEGLIKISPKFISNISQAHQMITGEYNYPPNIQWKSTLPIIHPLVNLFFVGFAPVTFILTILGISKTLKNKNLLKNKKIILIFAIILFIFIYHSILLARYMRYFYPIYPILIIFTGYALTKLKSKTIIFFCSINLIFTLAFIHIYLFPHSRYQASEWICQHIPNNSTLSSESWDDSLPLSFLSCQSKSYIHQDLALYDSESDLKWLKINSQLDSLDYLILSSNRLWGSIPKDIKDYSITSKFYQNLFDGNTDFKIIKKFYSYPGFSLPLVKKCILIGSSVYPYKNQKNSFITVEDCDNPGIYFRDDATEESFTVYDHPQVIIFQRQ